VTNASTDSAAGDQSEQGEQKMKNPPSLSAGSSSFHQIVYLDPN
jgi:hypothetical protein